MKDQDRYEKFLGEFENKIRHLIIDANLKFHYEFSENDEKIKLKIYISHLQGESIDVIHKHFKEKYIITVCPTKNKEMICINIY